jgi:hypothetical protein
MKNKIKNNILFFSFLLIFYLTSYLLLTYYVEGDQIYYRNFYDSLVDASASDVMPLAASHVSSYEPITAFILWIGAQLGIEKNIYISFLNILLSLGFFLLLKKYKVPIYLYAILFSNFYLIVLMTSAERLKIAYIFLVYAALIPGRIGLMLALASPLAHLSSFIFLFCFSFPKFIENFKFLFTDFSIKKRNFKFQISIFLIAIPIFLYLEDSIIYKASEYTTVYSGIVDFFNISLIFFIGIFVTRDRFQMVFSMLPLFGAIFMIGTIRVNMIAVTLFIYILLKEYKLHHPLVILLLFYLSIKSIPFIYNIFIYGNGFDGWLF